MTLGATRHLSWLGRSKEITWPSLHDVCASAATTHDEGPTPDDLAETVELVEAQDRRILAAQADLRDYEALSAGVAGLGRLDVVVANAGVCSAAMSWEITPERWHETKAAMSDQARHAVEIIEGAAFAWSSLTWLVLDGDR